MAFTIRPFRRFPIHCLVTYQAGPFRGQGTVWKFSGASRRRSGDLSRRQVPALGLLLSGLLMLASCGDIRYQVPQPLGYGTMPPGEAWVAMGGVHQSPGLQTVYFNPATVRRDGNLVTIEMLVDWKMMQGNRSPTRFYSTRTTKQFNCTGKLVRTLTSIDFYGHMGTGRPIGGGAFTNETYWVPIEPESLNQGLWEVACSPS